MLRHEFIQRVIDMIPNARYLEIGVSTGETFTRIKARMKTGVDPVYAFDFEANAEADDTAHYEVMTSDAFFQKTIERGVKKFDVVFLDGLHTFEQILKDLLAAVHVVEDSGIIVIDDVIPSDYTASVGDVPTMFALRRAAGSADASWMGDVYKIVWFVAMYMPFFNYATIKENHGQMVLWRGANRAIENDVKIKDISGKEFKDVVLESKIFNIVPFEEIISKLKMSE